MQSDEWRDTHHVPATLQPPGGGAGGDGGGRLPCTGVHASPWHATTDAAAAERLKPGLVYAAGQSGSSGTQRAAVPFIQRLWFVYWHSVTTTAVPSVGAWHGKLGKPSTFGQGATPTRVALKVVASASSDELGHDVASCPPLSALPGRTLTGRSLNLS